MQSSRNDAAATALRKRNQGLDVEEIGARIALYGEEFAADPHAIHEYMRAHYGAVVPVAIAPDMPATLVIGYRAAREVLNAPEKFPADPRMWQRGVPADHPLRPMLEYRANALRSTGAEHARYRTAINVALADLDVNALRAQVRRAAVRQINSFCGRGRAELIGDYARPLVFSMLNDLLGCSPRTGARIAAAIGRMFDGTDTAEINTDLAAALNSLVTSKQGGFGRDVTSRMLAHGELGIDEICQQLLTVYSAAIEPVTNLIVNTVALVLGDERFTNSLIRPALGIGHAINEILTTDPPMAAHCVTYPPQRRQIEGVWVPAHRPVIISMTACNRDPAVVAGGELLSNGYAGGPSGSWGMAFGSGPHACPVMGRNLGYYVAFDAITELLDCLPELRPTSTERVWRPGPFHRAMAHFEVQFPPTHIFGDVALPQDISL
ncbi:cytochrome P450 [Nocardia takedensis]